MIPRSSASAYIVPFFLFIAGLALVSFVRLVAGNSDSLLLQKPEYWIYPLQTILCGIALLFYWRKYDFGPKRGWILAIVTGLLVLALWISPQEVFHSPARREGFDPTVFFENPLLYWLTILSRFARLVIIVPLLEEIFWRGFLMRYLISEDFEKVPFGTFRPLSFFAVAGVFTLAHSPPDWAAAFLCGILYNALAIRTKSLAACVLAHAITNFGLGLYIMFTRQWGFW